MGQVYFPGKSVTKYQSKLRNTSEKRIIIIIIEFSGYDRRFQAPIVPLYQVSAEGLYQGILKWVYKSGNMVQWHDYRLSALPDKWTSSLRDFLTTKQVFSTTINIIIIFYTDDNDENFDI